MADRSRTWRLNAPVALIAAALAVCLAGMRTHGQIARDKPLLKSGVDLVIVTATVVDAGGQLVTGLPKESFEIYEDGDRQTVTQFTHERVPIGLGLLLDISDSMFGRRIVDARKAVERFLFELLDERDQFFVMAFNHAPRLLTRWSSEADLVRQALNDLKPSGGTAIYDAVIQALPIVQQRTQQRAALVVISDGADTASDAAIGDVRTAELRTDAFVYAVAIDSPKPQPINTRVNAVALGDITMPTGGHTAIVRDPEELAEATARIAEELNNQYVLGYSSPRATDGKFHSIRVKVTGDGYRVRARSGYIGSPMRRGK